MHTLKESPPRPVSMPAALKYKLWKFFEGFRKPDIKFAVKVGVGALLLTLPSFLEGYRDIYIRWRMEWALLSYFVVMASSVGATTSTGFWRYACLFCR